MKLLKIIPVIVCSSCLIQAQSKECLTFAVKKGFDSMSFEYQWLWIGADSSLKRLNTATCEVDSFQLTRVLIFQLQIRRITNSQINGLD